MSRSPFSNAIILAAIFHVFFLSGFSAALTVDRILATVGDEAITVADYRKFVKECGEAENPDGIDERLLKRLIEERIIVHEARRRGLAADGSEIDMTMEEFKTRNNLTQEDFETFLREEDMSVNDYRKILEERILVSQIINSEVNSRVIVNEKEAEDFYRDHRTDFLSDPEKVTLHGIFLGLREDATVTEITDLKRRGLLIESLLKEGYDFSILAEQYSDEPLKSQDGVLGSFVRGALIPPLDARAFMMKEGDVSEPIWVREGVYIIKLIGRSAEKFKSFDEAKSEIHDRLYEQKRDQSFNAWIKTLWEKSSVTIK